MKTILLIIALLFTTPAFAQPSIMIEDLNGEKLAISSTGTVTLTWTNTSSSVDAGAAVARMIVDTDGHRLNVNSDRSLSITFNRP